MASDSSVSHHLPTEWERSLVNLTDERGGIKSESKINEFMRWIRQANDISSRELAAEVLEQTSSRVLNTFAQQNGLEFIYSWLRAAADEQRAVTLLRTILRVLRKVSISLEQLKAFKLGKIIGKLSSSVHNRRGHSDDQVRQLANTLVAKWTRLAQKAKAEPTITKRTLSDHDLNVEVHPIVSNTALDSAAPRNEVKRRRLSEGAAQKMLHGDAQGASKSSTPSAPTKLSLGLMHPTPERRFVHSLNSPDNSLQRTQVSTTDTETATKTSQYSIEEHSTDDDSHIQEKTTNSTDSASSDPEQEAETAQTTPEKNKDDQKTIHANESQDQNLESNKNDIESVALEDNVTELKTETNRNVQDLSENVNASQEAESENLSALDDENLPFSDVKLSGFDSIQDAEDDDFGENIEYTDGSDMTLEELRKDAVNRGFLGEISSEEEIARGIGNPETYGNVSGGILRKPTKKDEKIKKRSVAWFSNHQTQPSKVGSASTQVNENTQNSTRYRPGSFINIVYFARDDPVTRISGDDSEAEASEGNVQDFGTLFRTQSSQARSQEAGSERSENIRNVLRQGIHGPGTHDSKADTEEVTMLKAGMPWIPLRAWSVGSAIPSALDPNSDEANKENIRQQDEFRVRYLADSEAPRIPVISKHAWDGFTPGAARTAKEIPTPFATPQSSRSRSRSRSPSQTHVQVEHDRSSSNSIERWTNHDESAWSATSYTEDSDPLDALLSDISGAVAEFKAKQQPYENEPVMGMGSQHDMSASYAHSAYPPHAHDVLGPRGMYRQLGGPRMHPRGVNEPRPEIQRHLHGPRPGFAGQLPGRGRPASMGDLHAMRMRRSSGHDEYMIRPRVPHDERFRPHGDPTRQGMPARGPGVPPRGFFPRNDVPRRNSMPPRGAARPPRMMPVRGPVKRHGSARPMYRR